MSKAGSVRGAGRTSGGAGGDADHELREPPIPDYIDELLSHLNSIIIETKRGDELTAMCEERRALRDTKRAMKSNACVAQSILISFGREIQPDFVALPIKTQDKLYLKLMNKIAKEANTDVSGLVAHRDETAPHAHGQLVGYNRDGIPLTKVMNREFRRNMQDWMVEIFKPHLPNIERGVRKSVRLAQGDDASKTIHRSVQELHGSLGPEIEAAKVKLAEVQDDLEKHMRHLTKARDDLEKAIAENGAESAKAEKIHKRLTIYENRLEGTEIKLAQLESDIEAKQTALDSLESRTKDAQRALEKAVEGKRVQEGEVDALRASCKPLVAAVMAFDAFKAKKAEWDAYDPNDLAGIFKVTNADTRSKDRYFWTIFDVERAGDGETLTWILSHDGLTAGELLAKAYEAVVQAGSALWVKVTWGYERNYGRKQYVEAFEILDPPPPRPEQPTLSREVISVLSKLDQKTLDAVRSITPSGP